MKDKFTASLLALLLGGFGVHQFYLGKSNKGIFYLLFFWTFIPLIIAFIDFIILITMNNDDFNKKYNPVINNGANNNFTDLSNYTNQNNNTDYYPKSENEAIAGLLLKIGQSNDQITSDEKDLVKKIMNDTYNINVNTEMNYYDISYLQSTDKYKIIDKYINYVSDKNKLLKLLILVCLTNDKKVDSAENSFLVYFANKSGIPIPDLNDMISDLSEKYK